MESSEFCQYHESANRNLIAGYEKWSVAYGGMEWKQYLGRIENLDGAGQWAKDVAKYLAKR